MHSRDSAKAWNGVRRLILWPTQHLVFYSEQLLYYLKYNLLDTRFGLTRGEKKKRKEKKRKQQCQTDPDTRFGGNLVDKNNNNNNNNNRILGKDDRQWKYHVSRF